jgi:vacuolar-type H+-ATPase subunit F/Vma7
MKIAIVGDHDMILGFLLTGVKLTRTVRNAEETIDALEYFLGLQNVGIILLQARMASMVRAYLAGKIHRKNLYPVILEIEDRSHPADMEKVSMKFMTGTETDPGMGRSDHG